MTRRESDLDLRLFYNGNLTSYCPGTSPLQAAPCTGRTAVTPALAAPPTITGVETSFDAGTLTFKVRVIGELVAGIQDVWVTWTIPPAAGNTGTWASIDPVQESGRPVTVDGHAQRHLEPVRRALLRPGRERRREGDA